MKKSLSVYVIIIIGFFLYNNSLNGKFIWDDNHLINDSVCVKNWNSIPKVFTKTMDENRTGYVAFYRPVQIVTYAIDYSLWGLNVRGYHLTNILLHILTALALFWLINILFSDRSLALFTSVLFVIHPVHTEAVAYISGRADALTAMFMLLCLIFYIKQHTNSNRSGRLIMLLCYILALLSRENSLILPALIILYHYTFKKRFDIKKFLPILIITLVYIYLRMAVLRSPAAAMSASDTLLNRIPGFFAAIANYLRIIVLPFGLHMEYGYKFFKFTDPKVILGAVILFTLLIYAFKKRNTDKLVFFSIAWFVFALLPSSNLYPINAYMAEHWLYVPSMGIFLLLSSVLLHLYRSKKQRVFAVITAIVLAVFYSSLTIMQNNCWKDPIAFYERTLKYSPDSPKIYANLANEYQKNGDTKKAISLCKKAIEIKPDYATPYNTLGFIYYDTGSQEEAIALYKKAIEIEPDFAEALYNLGVVYMDTGRDQEAAELLLKTIAINGDFALAYNNLGNLLYRDDKMAEAAYLYNKAIEIDPYFVQAYNNLGVVCCNIGKREEGIVLFRKAIEIDPHFDEARDNLRKVCQKGP